MRSALLAVFISFTLLVGCHLVDRAEQCNRFEKPLSEAKTELSQLLGAVSDSKKLQRIKQLRIGNTDIKTQKEVKLIIDRLTESLEQLQLEPGELKQSNTALTQSLKNLNLGYKRLFFLLTKKSKKNSQNQFVQLRKEITITRKQLKKLQQLCL